MFDRASGSLRFFTMLKLLARQHELIFYAYDCNTQIDEVGENETQRYRNALEEYGIRTFQNNFLKILKQEKYDAVFFEFYYSAIIYLNDVRFWQPTAKIIIDSVDVHYHRLLAKAKLTNNAIDYEHAKYIQKKELSIYLKADMIIAVTEDDKKILLAEDSKLAIEIIPNIFSPRTLSENIDIIENSLIFIGGFAHDPNIDAMLYFCKEILPIIQQEIPNVRLRIIGSSIPEGIKALANKSIEVVGYVPDTQEYLQSSYISIAPLRYGAGMKGKVGEAMTLGLPVVSTSIGIEGIGLTPEENILMGNTPEEFSNQIIRLLQNKILHKKISASGQKFMHDNYSETALESKIYQIFDKSDLIPVKKLPLFIYIQKTVRDFLERNFLWRIK